MIHFLSEFEKLLELNKELKEGQKASLSQVCLKQDLNNLKENLDLLNSEIEKLNLSQMEFESNLKRKTREVELKEEEIHSLQKELK